jgi:bacterioferritin
VEGKGLIEMIREDLVAERIVIESYSETVRFLGNDDPSTRRPMEEILAEGEDHANDLRTLLESLGKDEG